MRQSNHLLSTAREEANEHKHNKDDHDDPEDSADRKEHSERCEHSRLLVGVSVSSLLVGLRNEELLRAVVRSAARAEGLIRCALLTRSAAELTVAQVKEPGAPTLPLVRS